jgi:putative ABC transport system permease protein
MLVGLVMLLPLILAPLTLALGACLGKFWGVESRLAQLQVLRHRARSTLTIGVLFVAIATGLGLASSVVDNVADVRAWYRAVIRGDLFVRAAMPDMETGLSAAVPDRIGAELRQIEGVVRLGTVRLASVTAEGQRVVAVAMGDVFSLLHETNAGEMPFSPPSKDEVLIGSVLAQRLKRKAGDSITLDTLQGPQALRIRQVCNDYSAGGLSIHMNLGLAQRLLGIEGVDAFLIKADPARLADVEAAVRAVCAREGLLLQSYTDLTQMIEGMMAGLVASLWGLMILGLIVAAVGVVNTLSMNVLEQTREWGLLRVVGMTRMQVRKAILAQGLMLGILGLTPGVAAGLALALIINLTTLPVIGHPVAFRFPGLLSLLGFLVALSMVLIAAWAPAARAARLAPAEALRYD